MIEQTKNQMNQMQWHGALRSLDQRIREAQENALSYAEFLSALVTDEKLYRDNRAIHRRLKAATFRTPASFDHVDYTEKRNVTKAFVQELRQLHFIRNVPRNILFVGATGVGKTFLASAVGEHACREGFTCHFVGMNVLIERWLMTRADGTFLKYRDRLCRYDLLIIDDIGLKRLTQEAIQDLHDLLEERQSKCTLITTQLPLRNWKEIIDDELALDTIVDKIAAGTQYEVTGPSMRPAKNKKKIETSISS